MTQRATVVADDTRILDRFRDTPEPLLQAIPADQFLLNYEPPTYVLDPIAPRGQLLALTALSNAGKTTVALQLTLAAAGLATLPGIEADPGPVLYLIGENDLNLASQLIAACEQHDIVPAELRRKLWIVPQRFGLYSMIGEIASLADQVGGFALIVVDTRIAYSDAVDENDNSQAVEDARALRDLTRVIGTPAVLALCHPPKGAGRDNLVPRGGSSFYGEIDANLMLWTEDMIAELWAGKKRMPDFEPIRWQLEVVKIDRKDRKGRQVRSVIARRITDVQEAEARDVARLEEDLLLVQMIDAPAGSLRDWATGCKWEYGGKPAASRVQRVLSRLAAAKLAANERGRWVLTNKGRKAAEDLR